MQVADLLLPLGIYFGSSQVQSSKVLNICQGLGLVLFSTDHSVLWNSWKIRLNDIYCLFVNLSRLGSWGHPELQTQALPQPKFCDSFHLLQHETQYMFPSGRCTSSTQKTLPHCLRHVMSHRLWPFFCRTATTWPQMGPAKQGLQDLILLTVLTARAPVHYMLDRERHIFLHWIMQEDHIFRKHFLSHLLQDLSQKFLWHLQWKKKGVGMDLARYMWMKG